MSERVTRPLADAFTAHRGIVFPATAARTDPFTNSVRCLTTSAVQHTVDWSSGRYVPRELLPRRYFKLQRGDVLISTANSKELVGKSAYVEDCDEEVVFGAFITMLRPKPGFDDRFLFYLLRSPQARKHFWEHSSQTTGISNLKPEKVLELQIFYPPYPEQRRIANAIDAAMGEAEAAARATEAQTADLDRLEFRVFENAFPVRPLTLKDSEDAPEGWTWRLLTSVARLESGHTPSRRHPEWWGGDTPWIALPDIRAFDGSEAHETLETVNDGGLANSSARLLPAGTVCLSRTASVGFVTVMGRPMATSQDFVNWVCGDRLDPWFLAYALMASRGWIRSLASGATHKTIYMPTLKAFRVCVPDDVRVQAGIVAHVEQCRAELRAARAAAAAQRSAVQALPAAILTAAFQGNL